MRACVCVCTIKDTYVLILTGCGEVINQSEGTLVSPNYPNDYPYNANCEWYISIPSGIILLVFTDFDVQDDSNCYYDSLKVRC